MFWRDTDLLRWNWPGRYRYYQQEEMMVESLEAVLMLEYHIPVDFVALAFSFG
jgi:hypothetical protein